MTAGTRNVNVTTSRLTTADIEAVDGLMKLHSRTLGFLPHEALRDHLERRTVLGAKTDDGRLAGYLLYAAYPNRFRVAQLCVSNDFTRQGIARQLVDDLRKTTITQTRIELRCRRDFPAHEMWPRLGFIPLSDEPGRSLEGHLLTLWRLTFAQEHQLDMFQEKISSEAIDVVIDANVFFDFEEPDSDQPRSSDQSKALVADYLIDTLELLITDEVFVEINRQEDPQQRRISQSRAHKFRQVKHDPQLTEYFKSALVEVLPNKTQAQQSDIRQLAKTAASDVDIFVTRDNELLKKSEEISERTKLTVLSPTQLIIQLHELSQKRSYAPIRVSGSNLQWRRVNSGDLVNCPFDSFLDQEESKSKFKENLDSFLSYPDRYRCDLLEYDDSPVAIRVIADSDGALVVYLARVSRSQNRSLFERFLITDTISEAVRMSWDMVKFEQNSIADGLISDLLDVGFLRYDNHFERFCFSRHFDRAEVLSKISKLSLEFLCSYQNMPDRELERHCSPLGLRMADQRYFLIPIRPVYAMSLFDTHQSAADLFGGETNVLLRWDNVYYRRKAQHKMLMAPARILWYVSGKEGKIIAVSHLDDVQIDIPKKLYKQFRRFGILEWRDLFEMCGGDPSKEIMALKFSHTFAFRNPVPLNEVRAVFKEEQVGFSVQGPRRIPVKIFQNLYQLGYPEEQS